MTLPNLHSLEAVRYSYSSAGSQTTGDKRTRVFKVQSVLFLFHNAMPGRAANPVVVDILQRTESLLSYKLMVESTIHDIADNEKTDRGLNVSNIAGLTIPDMS